MSSNACRIHACDRKAKVQGFCLPHYRQFNSRYVELYEHLQSLYNDYGSSLFERAVEEILAPSRKHRRHARSVYSDFVG